MFKTSVMYTPFTTDAANAYFQNITGSKYGNDNTFLSTLRALVAPRIKEDESLCVQFGSSDYNSSTVGSAPADRVTTAICSTYSPDSSRGLLAIHSFKSDPESNIANMRVIQSRFTACYEGYHCLDKVKVFYQKSFKVDCYINPERKNVVVFVDNLDVKKLHYLQVSILAFLPWYFDPSAGVSEDEMELLKSLRESSPAQYEACIAKLAEQYDFKSARVRQLLAGFETRYEKIECDKVRADIESLDSSITRYNNEIGSMLNKRNDKCIRLMGLERKIAEGGEDSEIMEYFLCNTRLYLEEVTNTDMYFSVKDYLAYFDTEMAERTINNLRSFVYPYGDRNHNGITRDGMKKLMTEIFVSDEPRLRIKSCAAYRFALNGNVSPMGRHTFSCEFSECLPNLHIDNFTCMGNYNRTINQLLERRDYIGALEQCIASSKSLNWGDSPVMGEFMKTMWGETGYNNRCIELPDGKVVKPVDAIKWLEQQEAPTNEAREEAQDE